MPQSDVVEAPSGRTRVRSRWEGSPANVSASDFSLTDDVCTTLLAPDAFIKFNDFQRNCEAVGVFT